MAARTDRVTDPVLAAQLLLARRGQAFFSRKLNELSDAEFPLPSRLPGWDRSRLIAHVGLNARALTRLTQWASTGIETPMYDSPNQRNEEIDLTATLPPQALRNLSAHAAIHLSVEWRDLTPAAWSSTVITAQGRVVPASETVWMRTREVWIHAVDLDNGASFGDFPAELVDRLLDDVGSSWRRRAATENIPDLMLEPIDRDDTIAIGSGSGLPVTVRGTAAALAAWATGREASGVASAGGESPPTAPRWL
jgi:maleylpyruvate isomerase